jgi:hypothetical protein
VEQEWKELTIVDGKCSLAVVAEALACMARRPIFLLNSSEEDAVLLGQLFVPQNAAGGRGVLLYARLFWLCCSVCGYSE